MIIGNIDEDDRVVKITLDLHCSSCGKKVPGNIKVSEKFYKSQNFEREIIEFKRNYLCGVCRDKKRVS